MARTNNLTDFLTDVADAIRTKKGSQETIQASDFDTEIENLPSGGGGLDWSGIGYSGTPQSVIDNYNYSKSIYDNWQTKADLMYALAYDNNLIIAPLVDTSISTNLGQLFYYDQNLKEIPLLDTSNATLMNSLCSFCTNLTTVPVLNTSNITTMGGSFQQCPALSDTSLDNILQMCINANSYTDTKTLYAIGLRSSTYSVSKIQALPHYQDFINAGWTIGY